MPTRPIIFTRTEAAPSFPAATAWFAPLPPGIMRKPSPSTVSPAAGRCFVRTTKSMFRLPTTTTAGFMGVAYLEGSIPYFLSSSA